jgi:hypothetical protein
MVLMRRQPRERVLKVPKQIEKSLLLEDFPPKFVFRRKVGFATRIKYYQSLDGFAFTRSRLTPAFKQYLEGHGLPVPSGTFPPSAAAVFRSFPEYWKLAVLSAFLERNKYL